MKYWCVSFFVLLSMYSCKKKGTTVTPILDSPAYSFFAGRIGANDVSAVFTNDGNIAIVGTAMSTGELLLLKLSQSGNELMRKQLLPDTSIYGSPPDFSSITQTEDGGYLVCGTIATRSTWGGSSTYSTDFYAVKLNSKGERVWSRTYGGGEEDYGKMVIRTKDNNYLLCGISYSFTTEAYDDIYMVKVDKNGTILWERNYEKHEQQTPFDIVETKNGDYLVAGTDEPTGHGRIVYLLRVAADGTKRWDNTIGSVDISHWRWGYCVAECPSGDLMVGGSLDSKVLLIKTDASGNKKWENTYAADSGMYLAAMSMRVRPDNSCVMTGGSGGIVMNGTHCFLLKTDADGNKKFLKVFSGSGSTTGSNLLINSAGDNIIAGYQYIGTSWNIFLTRADVNGNYK